MSVMLAIMAMHQAPLWDATLAEQENTRQLQVMWAATPVLWVHLSLVM